MPTYDYVCSACGHAFEQFQEMSAKKLRKCPKCGKSALERQVGAGAGLIFKGTGFYITDYRKGSPPAESGAAGAKTSESPAEGKAKAPEPPKAGDTKGSEGAAPTTSPAAKTTAAGKGSGGKGPAKGKT